MRSLILVAVSALTLAACASQAPAPAPAPAKPVAAAPAKKPQCYSGDHGKFFDLGAQTSISGVEVVCQATSDGKGGQWMGVKSKH